MILKYRGHSDMGTKCVKMTMQRMLMPAAPTPWIDRPTISMPTLYAAEDNIVPIVRMAIDELIRTLSLNVWLSDENSGMEAALVIR